MKTREQIEQILSGIILNTNNPKDILDLAEVMYRIGFFDGTTAEEVK